VIGHQRPGINLRFHICGDIAQAGYELFPIFVIINDPAPFNSSEDNVMQRTRNIESCLTGHNTTSNISPIFSSISQLFKIVNNVPKAPMKTGEVS
jgi:hypothetical protein